MRNKDKHVLLASNVAQHNNSFAYPTEIHSIQHKIIHLFKTPLALDYLSKIKVKEISFINLECAIIFLSLKSFTFFLWFRIISETPLSILPSFFRYKFTSNLTPSHKNIPFPGVFTKISSCPVCVVNRRRTEQLGSSPPDPKSQPCIWFSWNKPLSLTRLWGLSCCVIPVLLYYYHGVILSSSFSRNSQPCLSSNPAT